MWPRGWVPLIGGGCQYKECVDFFHPPHSVALFDGGERDRERSVVEAFRPAAASLEVWLAGEQAW